MKTLKSLLLALVAGFTLVSPGFAGETKEAKPACGDCCKQCCGDDQDAAKCAEKPASNDAGSKVDKK